MTLCQCGCGLPAPIATMTSRRDGAVKGQPQRFIKGHYQRTVALVSQRHYPSAHRGGGKSVMRHQAAAEAALGRRLPDGAEVHHVDGNRHNHANSNLVICQDRHYHRLLHVRSRVVRAGGDPDTQNLCRVCRTLKVLDQFAQQPQNSVTGRSNLCKPCRNAYLQARRDAATGMVR